MLSYRRALLSAIIAVSLAVPAAAVPMQVAFAGGTCTGWTSIDEPPETIRVGRADGTVEVVEMRQYVGTVLAKEWSYTHPAATLETAAVAIKQYAWYYAMAGKWRKTYVTELGECYDVKDSTADQLYKPHLVPTIDPRTWQAVDNTWGLSVRKGGQFFLTTYRTGTSKVCASDVTGWRLFAKSIINCGKIGWSREEIQTAYYAPDVTFHWADDGQPDLPTIGQTITPPNDIDLMADTSSLGEFLRVRWDADDARPQGTFYQLQQSNNGLWADVALADPTQRAYRAYLKPGRTTYQFRVRLANAEGSVGPWFTGPSFKVRLKENPTTSFGWSGGWKKAYPKESSGGSVGYATQPGAVATFSFTGREVALVGTLGPTRGQVRVWVDGVLLPDTYDMWAKTTMWRQVWFRHEFADAGPHTVAVEVVGTPGRPRVDVDAGLFLP